jgi:hypothetical protein
MSARVVLVSGRQNSKQWAALAEQALQQVWGAERHVPFMRLLE